MVGQKKVVYLNTSRTSTSNIKVLNELCSLAHVRLETLLRQAFDQVDDVLFDRAEKAGNNTDQTMFFATMRQVRLSRRMAVQIFVREIESAFAQLTQPPASEVREPAADSSGMGHTLELMDEAVVEENVAAETIVGKIRTRCALALSQLVTRLDDMVAESSVEESNNPLDPRQIVNAFIAATDQLDIEIQPKLIIFKLFEKQALQHLAPLYEEANRLLIDAGILPKLRGSSESTGSPRHRTGGGHEVGTGAASAVGAEEDGATLEVLQQLLEQVRGGEWAGSRAAAAGGVSLPAVVHALSALQHQPGSGWDGGNPARPLNADDLRALLGRSLPHETGGTPRSLERTADDTIDIVSMLFDVILDDSRLSPSIKALIARLQIPVLKVALLDRGFFSSRQHPARALINELAHAAVGWTELENPDSDPLYRKMSEVMNRILEGFDEDIGLFERVLQDFRQFLDQEKERARTVEERTRQTAEGKAKVEEARERVQSEIERRLRGEAIPPVVRRVLEGPWFKVLFITCVKDGPQGETWESRLELMDRLIWSVQPKPDPDERRRMLTSVPALLNDLREGLNVILYNPFEMTRLFKELEAEHIRCLSGQDAAVEALEETLERGGEAESVMEEDTPRNAALTGGKDSPALSSEEQQLQEQYLQRLSGVELGTWFEFSADADRQIRAKLSARLNGGRRLIFVNRAGFKLADKTIAEMAGELSSGRAFILDHNMLFDKALEQVITNLRELRAGQEL